MINETLMCNLCCTVCKDNVEFVDNHTLECSKCKLTYRIKSGIPVMISNEILGESNLYNSTDSKKNNIINKFNTYAPNYNEMVNKYMSFRRSEIIKNLSNGTVLEIGCGSGSVTGSLSPDCKITGMDISIEMVKVVKNELNINGVVGDAEKLPFKNNVFDTVIAPEVIYYLNDPINMIRESYRVLKNRGVFIISTISQKWMCIDKIRTILGNLGIEVGSFDGCYSSTFDKNQLIGMLEEIGFRRLNFQGMVFFPFYNLDYLNRIIEKTYLHKFGIDLVVWGKKIV